jgi:hypothetical protein
MIFISVIEHRIDREEKHPFSFFFLSFRFVIIKMMILIFACVDYQGQNRKVSPINLFDYTSLCLFSTG